MRQLIFSNKVVRLALSYLFNHTHFVQVNIKFYEILGSKFSVLQGSV